MAATLWKATDNVHKRRRLDKGADPLLELTMNGEDEEAGARYDSVIAPPASHMSQLQVGGKEVEGKGYIF